MLHVIKNWGWGRPGNKATLTMYIVALLPMVARIVQLYSVTMMMS